MERERLIEEMARAITEAESGRPAAYCAEYVAHPIWGPPMRKTAQAILARLDALGLVVVPLEPTKEMCDAAWHSASDEDCDDHYRAMIAAALRAPEGGGK